MKNNEYMKCNQLFNSLVLKLLVIKYIVWDSQMRVPCYIMQAALHIV